MIQVPLAIPVITPVDDPITATDVLLLPQPPLGIELDSVTLEPGQIPGVPVIEVGIPVIAKVAVAEHEPLL